MEILSNRHVMMSSIMYILWANMSISSEPIKTYHIFKAKLFYNLGQEDVCNGLLYSVIRHVIIVLWIINSKEISKTVWYYMESVPLLFETYWFLKDLFSIISFIWYSYPTRCFSISISNILSFKDVILSNLCIGFKWYSDPFPCFYGEFSYLDSKTILTTTRDQTSTHCTCPYKTL